MNAYIKMGSKCTHFYGYFYPEGIAVVSVKASTEMIKVIVKDGFRPVYIDEVINTVVILGLLEGSWTARQIYLGSPTMARTFARAIPMTPDILLYNTQSTNPKNERKHIYAAVKNGSVLVSARDEFNTTPSTGITLLTTSPTTTREERKLSWFGDDINYDMEVYEPTYFAAFMEMYKRDRYPLVSEFLVYDYWVAIMRKMENPFGRTIPYRRFSEIIRQHETSPFEGKSGPFIKPLVSQSFGEFFCPYEMKWPEEPPIKEVEINHPHYGY